MKCCKCHKDVDISDKTAQYPPPKWFGMFRLDELVKLICAECYALPANKEEWRNGTA